jgi:hypothetical protein
MAALDLAMPSNASHVQHMTTPRDRQLSIRRSGAGQYRIFVQMKRRRDHHRCLDADEVIG